MSNETNYEEMMKGQDLDYHWFQENRKKLFSQYPNKHLVISNERIIGAFDSFEEAFNEAVSTCKPGEFIIQECEEKQTILYSFNNRVSFA